MKTVTIQIGNTDDKLTQKEWSEFVAETAEACEKLCDQMHFHGGSANCSPWQNSAWIIVIGGHAKDLLRARLKEIRERYRQDSVAWTEGETIFV